MKQLALICGFDGAISGGFDPVQLKVSLVALFKGPKDTRQRSGNLLFGGCEEDPACLSPLVTGPHHLI